MAAEGAVVDTPAGSEPVAPAVGTRHDPTPNPAAGVKPATSQPEYKWEEDTRTRGMQTDLQRERKARQDYERKVAEYEMNLTEERRRVAALTGIKVPSKDETDTEAIRARLKELYPELDDLGAIKELRNKLDTQAEQQAVRESTNHSIGIVSQIHKGIAAQMGDLSDKQKESIGALYFYRNFNDPEFHARHVAGDPTLIQEFVKDYLDNVYTPIKSKVTDSEARRFRPVPGGKDRSSPMRGEKPIDVTDEAAMKGMLAKKFQRDRA